MAALITIAALIVPGLIVNRLRQSVIHRDLTNWGLVKNLPNAAELGDVAPLAAIYQTQTIIGAALIEGAAFLAGIAYMLEQRQISLYVAGALLVLIASQFPTVSRLEGWIENELAGIQQMRQLR
jgi:hypothetical protein